MTSYLLLIIPVALLAWFFYEITKPFRKTKSVAVETVEVEFEKQLEKFEKLGFKLNYGVEVSDLLEKASKEEYEKSPYSLLYTVLGLETRKESSTPITVQLWNFDTEAIEDHGDYVRILENLKRVSGGELAFQNIKDEVDIDKGSATVSFDLNGDHYDWNLQVNDDWVDLQLFSKIVELTEKYKTIGRLTAFIIPGQEIVIGWLAPEQLEKVRQETGLDINWLE